MKLYLILIISASALLSSCANCIKGDGNVISETRNISGFNGIVLNSDAEVILSKDSAGGIRIEAETSILPEITTTISRGVLNIGTRHCISPKKPIKIYCSMNDLREVELISSGSIKSTNVFPSGSGQLEVSLDGSGEIKIGSNAEKISTDLNGSGDVELKGGAGQNHIHISGSGNVHAFELSTNDTKVDISGSGSAEVSVNKSLDANISGSGDIYYKGDPEIKNISSNGSGKVKKKD